MTKQRGQNRLFKSSVLQANHPLPSMICCIGKIELWIREYTIGEAIDPPEGPSSMVRALSLFFPPAPVELSLGASSGSRSSAWVIHSR